MGDQLDITAILVFLRKLQERGVYCSINASKVAAELKTMGISDVKEYLFKNVADILEKEDNYHHNFGFQNFSKKDSIQLWKEFKNHKSMVYKTYTNNDFQFI
jgi:1-aminocyclopropane-1-carboxylate deaminase/D-cysteine desulfhydrase-like pyridoxal-dependent ACC family enzyme